jgi:hypothetical protein
MAFSTFGEMGAIEKFPKQQEKTIKVDCLVSQSLVKSGESQ